jgi:predicted Zn-dependent peptidase
MTYLFKVLFCAAITVAVVSADLWAQVPDSPAKIAFQPLGWKVPLGAPYRQVLNNGLVAYIAEDHSLPYFKLSGYVRYGSICDPAGKEGISSLMATLMRTGGTQLYQSDTLDYLIDLYALRISVSVSETQANFSCSSLSEFADTCLFLLSQILFHPSFEDNKLRNQTSIFLESIAHRFDNPDPILEATYEKAMYSNGQNTRFASAKSVARITKKDIITLHKNVFKTENMIIAVSGNFSSKTMQQKLCTLFPKAGALSADSLFPTISIKPLAKSVKIGRAHV